MSVVRQAVVFWLSVVLFCAVGWWALPLVGLGMVVSVAQQYWCWWRNTRWRRRAEDDSGEGPRGDGDGR